MFSNKQEALLLQKERGMLVSHKSKSNFQAHSELLVFVPFDGPYVISISRLL